MLKIHKGLKKKKKDKKHKRKGDDDLFDEEELERYRKEHQQLQHQGDEQGSSSNVDTSNQTSSSANSDEWQKFKALTAGIDCVLQKTQEDLDRIKSTSFFQRKPVPSEVPKAADNTHSQEEASSSQQLSKSGYRDKTGYSDKGDRDNLHCEEGFGEANEELAAEEEAEEEEEVEEEEDIFNTSYVDAVASGELKLAYIPDSPTEELVEGDDPFDTSIADKFIATNPKKRYLNLGCAVQVLSGKAETTSTSPAVIASSAAKRRILRPVQLLLDSFDEGTSTASEPIVPPSDSPVKTLLDEDPTDFGDKTPACEVLPLTAVVPAAAPASEITLSTSNTESQSQISVPLLESLSLAEFENLSSIVPAETAPFKQLSIDSCGSIDDEFAELAQTRKSVVVVTTPVAPPAITPTDLAISPISDLQPKTDIDPFDTSIADTIISDNQLESQSHLLGHQSVSVLAAIEDDDFDPRAEGTIPTLSTYTPEITLTPTLSPSSILAPVTNITQSTTNLPNTSSGDNYETEEVEEAEDYDPFDTSHIA